MDNNQRINPRMPNKGIVKQSFLSFNKDNKNIIVELNVVNASKNGVKGEIINPGILVYNIEEDLPVTLKVTFNNNLTINIESKIVWFKYNSNAIDLGLYLLDSMW